MPKPKMVLVYSQILIEYDRTFLQDVEDAKAHITERLIACGRDQEEIKWVEGPYIFRFNFPLSPDYGRGDHYLVKGTCYIPEANLVEPDNTDVRRI